jgi:hypothetical protein
LVPFTKYFCIIKPKRTRLTRKTARRSGKRDAQYSRQKIGREKGIREKPDVDGGKTA